jgi:hypothetical protein
MTAVTLDATIIASGPWLSRAADYELWAAAAHELAHRPTDFARRFVIEYHLPGFNADDKSRLAFDIESRADRHAMEVLRAAGVPVEALAHALEKEAAINRSADLRRRIAAIKSTANGHRSPSTVETAGCDRAH